MVAPYALSNISLHGLPNIPIVKRFTMFVNVKLKMWLLSQRKFKMISQSIESFLFHYVDVEILDLCTEWVIETHL